MENLNTNFDIETIALKDDYEGKEIATLIKSKANTGNRQSVLYIHGFVDYFFHTHVAQKFNEHGYDFYALDMRKYGHSLLPHQHACYARSLDEYFDEISYSIKQIYNNSKKKVLLLGHSTGGLIIGVYAHRGPEKNLVAGLIMNSPFLDMNTPKVELDGLNFMNKWLPKLFPYAIAQKHMPAAYGENLHKDFNGEWDYNLKWKPIKGFPAYYIWLKTIIANQNDLKNNPNINVPILLMHSSKTSAPKRSNKDIDKADVVLNIEHMKKIGPQLGNNVTLLEVKDGIHDLFLSKEPVRNFAFDGMFKWLSQTIN